MNFDIDIVIVVGFLIATLLVGLMRGGAVTNIQDFALGGRNFHTGALVSTIVATWISGSFLFVSIEKIYSEGITLVAAYLMFPSIFLIMNYFFLPRMQEFMGKMSVADAMDGLYGKHVGMITALTGAISCLGMVAVQFKIFGTLFDYFFNFGSDYSLIICSIIVIVYSTSGGIKSVTVTDIIQFLTFTIFLPIILFLLLRDVDLNNVYEQVGHSHFLDFGKLLDYTDAKFWSFITLLFYFTFPNFPPEIFQRILIAKNIRQIRSSFNLSFVFCLLIVLVTITMVILIYYSNPSLENNKIFHYIFDNYLFVGVKGLTMIGIIALIMSTADSNMNSSAVLFTNLHYSITQFSDRKGLFFARLYTIILGFISLYIALVGKDYLNIILTTASFYMPVVNIPLMFAILGFRTSTKSVLIGMAAGFTTSTIFLFINTSLDAIIPAMIMNTLFLFGSHYLLKQKGGWIKQQVIVDKEEKIVNETQVFSLKRFLIEQLPKNTTIYHIFGIVSLISSFLSMYSIYEYSENFHNFLVFALYIFMLVFSSFFLLYTLWPSVLRSTQFVMVIWYFSLTYILSFCSMFFVFLSDFAKLPLVILTLNTTLLLMLTRWTTALCMLFIGVVVSLLSYKYYVGLDSILVFLSNESFIVVVALVLVSTSVISLLKPQEEEREYNRKKITTLEKEVTHLHEKVVHYNERISDQEKEIERLGATAQKILNNVNHELRLPVGNVMNFAEMLGEGLGKFSEDQLKTLSDEVYKNSNRLSSMIMNMLDLATLNAKKLELDKKIINLGELVEDRVNNCRRIYLEDKKIDFELKIHSEIFVSVDPNYMRQVVDNLVINAIKFSSEGVISVQLLKNKDKIEFTIKDNGIGIPREELYDIFTPFKMGSNTESKAEGRGVGLALCKAAIEAHGGAIIVQSDGVNGARFRFVL